MPYSSSLTDAEWKILEPLLLQILPQKQRTRPSSWTKREIVDGILYQLKNGCNWEDLPFIFSSLFNRKNGTCIQWRAAGVIEQLMNTLHGQVRQQVKKKPSGQR
jgi:transposase